MTSAIVTANSQDLARYAFLDPARDTLAGLKQAVGTKLSITDLTKITIDNNGKLHIPTLGGDSIVDHVEGVVVVNHLWRGFYGKKYNKKEAGGIPQCTSNDGIRGIGDPGVVCETCPFNQWGSAGRFFGDGSRGKACKEFWHIYLWRAGKKKPDLLQMPSTSIGVMRQYMLSLLDEEYLEDLSIRVDGQTMPAPVLGVITRFTTQEIKGQWKIVPSVVSILPAAVWPHTVACAATIASMLSTPYRVGNEDSRTVEAHRAEPPIDTEERQGMPQPGATRARTTFKTDTERPGYGEVVINPPMADEDEDMTPTRDVVLPVPHTTSTPPLPRKRAATTPVAAPVFTEEELAGDGLEDIDL